VCKKLLIKGANNAHMLAKTVKNVNEQQFLYEAADDGCPPTA